MKPIAVITGGTRGIGYALAQELREDHELIVIGKDPTTLARSAQELGATPCRVDLADHDAIAPAVAGLGLERLDVLVHSAGVLHTGPLATTTNQQFTESFAVNVTAIAALTREFLPALEAAGGRVLMLNSGSGKYGSAKSPVYTTAKFALNGLAECLRLDLAPKGIRVATVAPGRTDTDMQRELVATEGREYTPEAYLSPGEVASALVHIIRQGGDVDYISIRPPLFRQ